MFKVTFNSYSEVRNKLGHYNRANMASVVVNTPNYNVAKQIAATLDGIVWDDTSHRSSDVVITASMHTGRGQVWVETDMLNNIRGQLNDIEADMSEPPCRTAMAAE